MIDEDKECEVCGHYPATHQCQKCKGYYCCECIDNPCKDSHYDYS